VTHTAETASAGLVDRIGVAMRQASETLDATCLLESRQGTVLAHAVVGSPAPQLVDAVLARTSLPLQNAVLSRRTVAVLPGGGVQSLHLDGAVLALTAPLVAAGVPLGWLWVLPRSRRMVAAEALADAAADVASAAAACLVADEPTVSEVLEGHPGARLPVALCGGRQLWVVAVRAPDDAADDAVAGLLELALRSVATNAAALSVGLATESRHLLLSSRSELSADVVSQFVERVLAACEVPLLAAMGNPASSVADLPRARAQADAALGVTGGYGRCVQVEAVRSEIVLQAAYDALREPPELGRDPLADLMSYDRRRGSAFAATLLTWLDCSGDYALTAACAGLHHNTVRYRVRRANELLGVSLDDPAVRLEVHLRLRAETRGRAGGAAIRPSPAAVARPAP
jgi:hypothetical protein